MENRLTAKFKQKKSISVTEIIILLLIIGISVAAFLLKFGALFDASDVQEADRLMQAVRQAQVERCKQENVYLVLPSRLTVLPADGMAQGSTYTLGNFTYDFLDPLYRGVGMVAVHQTKNYKLEMPSYLDGRICCDNCQSLRTKYPACAQLTQRADFQAASKAGCISQEGL